MAAYSVVIRTYNRCELVLECVASVLAQTRPAEQVIVVDDGSTDDTVASLRARFPGVLVVEQPNLGRSVAANRGVALAEHDWICLLDDDDLWHREKLAAVDAYLTEHPDALAVNHPVWLFRTTAGKSRHTIFGLDIDFVARDLDECHAAAAAAAPSLDAADYLKIEGRSYQELLCRNAGAYSASVIRKEIFVAAGGMPPALAYGEDWTLFLNVARLTEWRTLERRLAFYRIHDEQSTRSGSNDKAMLVAHLLVWFGGRPLPGQRAQGEVLEALSACQGAYRPMVQRALWGALRRGRFRLARDLRTLGRPLVIDRWSWLCVHLPPRLTARLGID